MEQPGRQGLVRLSQLTLRTLAEIEGLRHRCWQHDRSELPLDLQPEGSDAAGEPRHLLFYRDGRLAAYAGLSPGDPPEVTGMVHPEYRRSGIGRRLLEAVRSEFQGRGVEDFLLVCEEVSPLSSEFARAAGGRYAFSEYRLELDRAAPRRPRECPEPVTVRRATLDDVETLAWISSAALGRRVEAMRRRLREWMRSPGQRLYLGLVNGEPVGSLRAALPPDQPSAYLATFGVLPERQGRGYGGSILVQVLDALLVEGCQQVAIEVNTGNPRALSLYQACGFRPVAEFRYYRMEVNAAADVEELAVAGGR